MSDQLADIRARWAASHGRAAHDYTDGGCRVLAEHAFKDVPALLSRLDTLSETISGRFETVADERNHYMLRAADAEAQVEALTEALRFYAEASIYADDIANGGDVAREALSRVSRSEPAPPNAAELPCTRCGATPETGTSDECPECQGIVAAAPPVPEEQQ